MCRILIGPSVRLMLPFDVFQGSTPRPKPRERDAEGQGGESDRTPLALWAAEGPSESLHSLAGDGFIVCPTASDTLTSIVFASCEMKWHFWPAFFCFFLNTTLYETTVRG